MSRFFLSSHLGSVYSVGEFPHSLSPVCLVFLFKLFTQPWSRTLLMDTSRTDQIDGYSCWLDNRSESGSWSEAQGQLGGLVTTVYIKKMVSAPLSLNHTHSRRHKPHTHSPQAHPITHSFFLEWVSAWIKDIKAAARESLLLCGGEAPRPLPNLTASSGVLP